MLYFWWFLAVGITEQLFSLTILVWIVLKSILTHASVAILVVVSYTEY
jgi:hypothetical protein